MENPPQMTWQSLLRQRFYDAINVDGTERETQIIEMALKEMEAAFDKVRAEAKKEVVEYIKKNAEEELFGVTDGGGEGHAAWSGKWLVDEKLLDEALSPPSGGTK